MMIKTWGRFWRYDDIGKDKVSKCAEGKDTGESYQGWGPAMTNCRNVRILGFSEIKWWQSLIEIMHDASFVTYFNDSDHLHKIRMNPRFSLIIFFEACVGEDRGGGGHCQRGERRRSSKWFSSSWTNVSLDIIFDSLPRLFKILFKVYLIFFLQFKAFTCTCLEGFHCSRTT